MWGGRAAAWAGAERWLPFEDFSNQLHSPPFSVLLDCDSWQVQRPASGPAEDWFCSGAVAILSVSVLLKSRQLWRATGRNDRQLCVPEVRVLRMWHASPACA